MTWKKVPNQRNPRRYAFEATERGYIISAWEDRGYHNFKWEIRKSGTNFPILSDDAIDMNNAKSHAEKAWNNFLKTSRIQ